MTAGVTQGGVFELDMAGLEGQAREFIQTDVGAWHWENLTVPAGLRFASFRYTAPTSTPVSALGHFGPGGIEGKLSTGPFQGLSDALLSGPQGRRQDGRGHPLRSLAVRLGPDGTFAAGTEDVLQEGQFLQSAVLSDQQQRRQEFYRDLLQRSGEGRLEGRHVLFTWADPVDMHFTLGRARESEGRRVGHALLIIPLRLERSAPGSRVTIPGLFIPVRRVVGENSMPVTWESQDAIDCHLRFQLPAEVLPLEIERARLSTRISAPSQRVTISGLAAGQAGRPGQTEKVELHVVENPLDVIRVDITEKRLLHLDAKGGLHLHLNLSDPIKRGPKESNSQEEKWKIEYLELEVTGRCLPLP
jgi:hypothetical protein